MQDPCNYVGRTCLYATVEDVHWTIRLIDAVFVPHSEFV